MLRLNLQMLLFDFVLFGFTFFFLLFVGRDIYIDLFYFWLLIIVFGKDDFDFGLV